MATQGKREQILSGALTLFEAKGFHGTTIPEIAAAGGIAVGTIYRHFPTKEAMVNALLRLWQERFEAELLAPLPPTATPRAAFRLYWRRMAGFARTHPAAQRFLDLHDHGGYLDAAARAGNGRLEGAIAELIQWGRREGAMKALDPKLVVALLRGALIGLVRQASPDGGVAQHLVEEMEDCLWNAVAARG